MKTVVVDIGNTNISLGFWSKRGKIVRIKKIFHEDLNSLSTFFSKNKIDNVFIASVVPELTQKIKKIVKAKNRNIEIYFAGKDVKVPLKNKYFQPSALGIDRLLNAFYIKEKLGTPAVSVDVGSAITIDLISEKGEFLGGVIFPGFRLCKLTLSEKTALLPEVKLTKTNKIYGRTSEECINIGIREGISSLINRVTEKFEKLFSSPVYKIITGGDVTLLKSEVKNKFHYIPDLTLNALGLLWSKNVKKLQK